MRNRTPASSRSYAPPGMASLPAVLFAIVLMAAPMTAAAAAVPIGGARAEGPFPARIVDIDLRNLPRAPEWSPGDPIKEIPRRNNHQGTLPPPPPPVNPPAGGPDPLLELQERVSRRTFSPPDLNFPGQGFSGVIPPDPVGDVGADYYIQMINGATGTKVTIYNKGDGSVAAGPFSLQSLGTGICASGLGDPIVLYDQMAQRWLLAEFSAAGNGMCVYVSQTPDPIGGGWFAYQIVSSISFPDYPKYGVWSDAYYLSTNETSPGLYALDRGAMLAGAPATTQFFPVPALSGFGFQALLPSDQDGQLPPPAGAPNYFMRHRDDEVHNPLGNDPLHDFLEIWEFHVDFSTPANSTLTGPIDIPITEFDSRLCGLTSFSCFPQPGLVSPNLDPLREVLMWRLQYRNFGTHETLVGNLVTDVDGNDHGGIRWFELRKQDPGGWGLHQEGTYAPDQQHRWMGSAAMDADGNIALGFSVSGNTLFPAVRYAGRLAASPPGTLPLGEVSVIEGTGSHSSNRWGDYSAMAVDPVNGCDFWYTNMHSLANGFWATRISRFSMPGCGGAIQDPVPDIDADGGDGPLFVPPFQPVTISVSLSAGDLVNQQGDYWIGVVTPTSGTSVFIANTWPIVDFSDITLFTTPLAQGTYWFFFVLDDQPDGQFQNTWSDLVAVVVGTTAKEGAELPADPPDLQNLVPGGTK